MQSEIIIKFTFIVYLLYNQLIIKSLIDLLAKM